MIDDFRSRRPVTSQADSSPSYTSCTYRSEATEGTSSECGLVRQLAGDLPLPAHVDHRVCQACWPEQVNDKPVTSAVASVLIESTNGLLQGDAATAVEVNDAQLLKSFAQRHLDAIDCTNLPISLADRHDPFAAGETAGQRWSWSSVEEGKCSDPPNVGLLGYNSRTGLGYQNRDIAHNFPIKRWLAPPHPRFDNLPPVSRLRDATLVPCSEPSDAEIERWMSGLDWILFVETPMFDRVTKLAKRYGVRVAAVCNWEWTCLRESPWLEDVDLLICPTRHTLQVLGDWKRRFCFPWQISHIPWPIDYKRFQFRPRHRCQRFTFINGTGGVQARRANGSLTPYHRKGIEVLFEAARLVPDVPIIVYSQTRQIPAAPPNVELREPPADNRLLYSDGDVCIQPSHWEGLGLQLLECQAAGMPLVTTGASPMNEHNPMRTVTVGRTESVHLSGETPIESCLIDPADLAAVLSELHGTDIQSESVSARRFVEENHSWDSARTRIWQAMADIG